MFINTSISRPRVHNYPPLSARDRRKVGTNQAEAKQQAAIALPGSLGVSWCRRLSNACSLLSALGLSSVFFSFFLSFFLSFFFKG